MIRILVDSSSDYTLAEIKEKNMELLPISIAIGEKTYVDGIDMGRDEFYEILERSGEFPKTSQPSPQEFLDVFEDAKEKGDELICILLSSGLSGTRQTAVMAKSMVDYEQIHIIDSLSATYTIKEMADYACKLRADGKTAKEIVTAVEEMKSKVKVVAALDTLEYLGRGGRISKTVATIGDMANIKPIITVTEKGEIGMLGKCIGRNKAISYIIKHLQELEIDPDFPVYVIYSYGTDNCQRFETKLEKEGIQIADRLQIGSTIGAHIGPEAFGIIFVERVSGK
ncbi:DegV family protein [Roseburia hominis]